MLEPALPKIGLEGHHVGQDLSASKSASKMVHLQLQLELVQLVQAVVQAVVHQSRHHMEDLFRPFIWPLEHCVGLLQVVGSPLSTQSESRQSICLGASCSPRWCP